MSNPNHDAKGKFSSGGKSDAQLRANALRNIRGQLTTQERHDQSNAQARAYKHVKSDPVGVKPHPNNDGRVFTGLTKSENAHMAAAVRAMKGMKAFR